MMLFGIGYQYLVLPRCQHVDRVSEPKIEMRKWTYILAVFCIAICIAASIMLLQGLLEMKEDLHSLEALKLFSEKFICLIKLLAVLLFEFSMSHNHPYFVKYFNILLRIVNRRKLYGVESIISMKLTRKMILSVFVTKMIYISYMLLLVPLYFFKEPTSRNVVITIAMVVMYNVYYGITHYLVCIIIIYNECLGSCYKTLERSLLNKLKEQKTVSVLQKLQYLQKLYLHLVWNYKRHVLVNGNMFYFVSQFVMAVITSVHGYVYLTRFQYGMSFDFTVPVDIITLFLAMSYTILVANDIYNSNQEEYCNSTDDEMALFKTQRSNINDCLICAQRELVTFGAGLGFISVPKCPHSPQNQQTGRGNQQGSHITQLGFCDCTHISNGDCDTRHEGSIQGHQTCYVLKLFLEKTTLRNLIVTVAYGLTYASTLSIALYIVHTTSAYTECFNSCYDAIKETMEQKLREGPEGKSVLIKLQHLQKLYLHLVRNYKSHVLSTGNFVYFSEQFIFTVQIFVHGYLYTSIIVAYHMKFECLILFDSIAMFVVVLIIFPTSDTVYHSVQMLVLSFTLEKPIMRASHMFTFGLPLVPALVSNTVTYVLVALQFDQNLKSRISLRIFSQNEQLIVVEEV
nr:unnamed protein product [Callosobruchus chinensis]